MYGLVTVIHSRRIALHLLVHLVLEIKYQSNYSQLQVCHNQQNQTKLFLLHNSKTRLIDDGLKNFDMTKLTIKRINS